MGHPRTVDHVRCWAQTVRDAVAVAAVCVAVAGCSGGSADDAAAPHAGGNVLLVIADDFGIEQSPCYDAVGDNKAVMPTLEGLCGRGVVFDNVWVNPMCTPTRATMLTGQYGFRTGVLQVHDSLDDTTPTVLDTLNAQDDPYRNAVIGKWHISGDDPLPDAPSNYGVGHYAGFLSGAVESYTDWDAVEDGVSGHTNEYTTTWITDHAIDWIGSQGDDPWFLWLAYNAPHWPYHLPPAELAANVAGLSGDQKAVAADPVPYERLMAQALDTELGRLLDALDPDVRANTTIMFVGDNGSEWDTVQPPFSSDQAKNTVYEGGIHVPLVVAGAAVDRHGVHESALVNGVDIPATVLRLTGVEETTFHDGVSFDAALTVDDFDGREFLYSDSIRSAPFEDGRPGWAVRDDRFHLLEFEDGGKELYDVVADIGEHDDLIAGGTPDDLVDVVDRLERYEKSLQTS